VTFLFHNLILLRYIELESATGRALNIVKMRNSDHRKDVHRFDIDAPAARTRWTSGWRPWTPTGCRRCDASTPRWRTSRRHRMASRPDSTSSPAA
jgi:circadian clock protein KaiC